MIAARRPSFLRLWAAILVAYALLLHAETPLAFAAGLAPGADATSVHADHVEGTRRATENVHQSRGGDTCCAVCTSGPFEPGLVPVAIEKDAPSGDAVQAAAPVPSCLVARLTAWADARGPPA
ncbi:MAG: hypothetical protein ACWA6X_01025 [Bauldia sp.]